MNIRAVMTVAFSAAIVALPPAVVPIAQARTPQAAPVTYLDQGWTDAARRAYYFSPQGSRLMPYTWFLALEQEKSRAKFADNLMRFGWLDFDDAQRNPDRLPVGFTRDPVDLPDTGRWVGLNCAACHTAEATYRTTRVRIDGGPAPVDFGSFLADLAAAVRATNVDQEKFSRFAADVYGHAPSAAETQKLKDVYASFATGFEGQAAMRAPSRPAGPGRVDALGQIINTLAVTNLRDPDNWRPADAPTSYPPLWLTSRLDWVQWAPVATNPLGRNLGQVLGVFGQADFTNARRPFQSSALLPQLVMLEDDIGSLTPPRWPDGFGRIDETRSARGKALFDRDCRSCHTMPPFELTPATQSVAGTQFIKTRGIPVGEVGTDPAYSLSLTTRYIRTGALSDTLFDRRPVVPALDYFLRTVAASLRSAFADLGVGHEDQIKLSGYRYTPGTPPAPWPRSPESGHWLKAGPLLGVWATGPFLHNGSVPNVDELLLPPGKRSTVFWVGSRELNVDKLGYRSTRQELSDTERAGLFLFDTTAPGNGNYGHAYPKSPYTDKERMAVIEYLKDPELGRMPKDRR